MDITKLGVIETASKIKSGEFTAREVVDAYLENIQKNISKNAILEVFEDAVLKADEIDKKIKNGEKVGRLAGVPIVIKDNLLYKGKKASCGSRFMKDFVSPYTSTVVQKLLDEDAVILGRANMDEFAMGGSNENSAFGPCKNAHDDSRVAGGSSGGSAVAVACNMCAAALGSDTGGSVRQPSSFNGVVGVKPTYGRVSRYGLIAFASSLDQVGPITKNVEDNAVLLEIIAGRDEHDETSSSEPVAAYIESVRGDVEGKKIGVIKTLENDLKNTKYYDKFNALIEKLRADGAEIVECEIDKIELSLPVYYILAPAEAASNLGRFDGVKYTTRTADAKNIDDVYVKSRTEGFGDEVKRRILLGNYVLSSGYYDAYYLKAKKVKQLIKNKFEKAFENCDVILLPTTIGEAFKLGEKTSDPVSMYVEDMFTVPVNIAGIASISVPYAKGENDLPLGVQVMAKHFNEAEMYNMARAIEKEARV